MSNPSTEFLEFPETTKLQAGMTYVVRKDHPVIKDNASIPADVTIIFMGGILTPYTDPQKPVQINYTLKGNKTKIVAPITQIFAENLTIDGSWEIDRAYPQWFGAKTRYTDEEHDLNNIIIGLIDSTDAINKAIIMKGTGEVFIPRGIYKINKTIFLKSEVSLIGEAGRVGYKEYCGTVLVPYTDAVPIPPRNNPMAGQTTFTNGYLIMVNVKHSGSELILDEKGKIQWEIGYPNPGTVIKDIFFTNEPKKIGNLKCIYSAGNLELYNCIWSYFQLALYCSNHYLDQKKVQRCTFNGAGSGIHEEVLYAFDFGYLGDALIFENNAIHSNDGNNGVRIANSSGGIISSNIINADVSISGSKGIVFESNHMEGEVQLAIERSNVTVLNNFFWKGKRPNIRIFGDPPYSELCIVNLSNNSFVFYTSKRNIKEFSEYDIQIDNHSTINISDTYRYSNKTYTYGIYICDVNGNPYTKFNQFSYLFSNKSKIQLTGIVENNHYVNGTEQLAVSFNSMNSESPWQKEGGTYYYGYQIIWDLERKIVSTIKEVGGTSDGIILTAGGNIPLFTLYGSYTCGYSAIIRLHRGKTKGIYTESVDIPMCGNIHIYENGFSVCGFRWGNLDILTNTNTAIQSIQYSGYLIECRSKICPTAGNWQNGDIVYNTSSSGTNSMWIFTNSGWIAR